MKPWFDLVTREKVQPLQRDNALTALLHQGILYVGGDDASEFLQNQLSNDINLITEERSQLSSVSNSKGRMYGVFRVIQIEGGYLLLMPKWILQDVQQRLQKYVLRSKVVLADITDSFARFSVTVSDEGLFDSPPPSAVNQVSQTDSLITLRLAAPPGQWRFLLLSNNADEAVRLWRNFTAHLAVNDEQHWKLMEILAGIPTLYPATQQAFVLQMCNLDQLEGVSFKKGCYPGQEVVARTHYLGKLKRRMFLAEIHANECPLPGHELTSRGADGADGSGKIVDAVYTTDDTCLALFVAVIAKAEAEQLVLLGQPDSHIRLLSLPYAVAVTEQ